MHHSARIIRESLRRTKETQLRIMLSAARIWEGRAVVRNRRGGLAAAPPALVQRPPDVGWGSGLDYVAFSAASIPHEEERRAA